MTQFEFRTQSGERSASRPRMNPSFETEFLQSEAARDSSRSLRPSDGKAVHCRSKVSGQLLEGFFFFFFLNVDNEFLNCFYYREKLLQSFVSNLGDFILFTLTPLALRVQEGLVIRRRARKE